MKNKNKDENIFYVYVYFDPRKSGKYTYGEYSFDYEPFYVGKGHGDRRFISHLEPSSLKENSHKSNKIKKIIKEINKNPIIFLIKTGLTEQDAFNLEINLISTIGRYDLKTGPLTNKTGGGEGSSGYVYPEERKKEMSKLMSGENNYWYGRGKEMPHFGSKWSDERTKLMSKKLSGNNNPMFNKTHTPEVRKRLSESHKGLTSKKYKLTSPQGEIFYAYKGLTEFCEKYNLSQPKLSMVANGKRKTHKGWKCEFI